MLRRAERFDSNPVPAVGAPQIQHLAGADRAATALILVANENTGLGGSREYVESANGNVAPSTVISHINGPYAIAFSSTEGIGIANGNIASGGQAALQTFGLAGDVLTGISCFPKTQSDGRRDVR
ncbi:MAG: hypothetical protein WBX26_05535 [Candidatus Cybelea sp.]